MNAKHPIDELFAQGLRDAEAAPPMGVWSAVVRQRGWRHRTVRLLRRRRGALALLLLLCAAGGYITIASRTAGGSIERTALDTHTTGTKSAPMVGGSTATSATEISQGVARPNGDAHHVTVTSSTNDTNDPEAAGQGSSATPTGNTDVHGSMVDAHVAETGSGIQGALASDRRNERTHDGSATRTSTSQGGRSVAADGSSQPLPDVPRQLARTVAPERLAHPKTSDQVIATIQHPLARAEESTDYFAVHQDPLRPAVEQAPPGGMPHSAPPQQPYAPPSWEWWIAPTVGMYSETREWKGNDLMLTDALNSTETPHYPWSVGIMAGREHRSGFGWSFGAEYAVARFDFNHTDRVVDRTETQTSFIVTLDTQVFVFDADTTLITAIEERRDVHSINRMTSLRIPLEASYHWNWRRWQAGGRVGLTTEFITSQSGLTLRADVSDGSVFSVNASENRTNAVMSATLGADLGYTLDEQWTLWLSPAYMRGVASFGNNADAYLLPERMGLRLRLSYTLPLR